MRAICTAALLGVLAQSGPAPVPPPMPHGPDVQDCIACHVSGEPREGAAALKPCSRYVNTAAQDAAPAPDYFILGELSDIYVPVVFPHEKHAGMMEMMGGCTVCHHRNPPGRIMRCGECHGGPSNPINLRQPGLKGAYHRQCLSCHRDWSHETACANCHVKKVPGQAIAIPEDPTDIVGLGHPRIDRPGIVVYTATAVEDAPLITFHHTEHVDLFGLRCVDCHKTESCNTCHDLNGSDPNSARLRNHVIGRRDRADPHQDCMQCHKEAIEGDCTRCHDQKERPSFNHAARSGFSLSPFHDALECDACHTRKPVFAGLEADCLSCHEPGWSPENFDHARTGVVLNDIHAGIDCLGCHGEGFGRPVTCNFCHDDDRTAFPEDAIAPLSATAVPST